MAKNMKQTFPVVGMACASCQAHVEKTLREMPGVNGVSVSLTARHAVVDYDPKTASPAQMKGALNDIGFDMVVEEEQRVEELERDEYRRLLRRTVLAWLLAALVMALSMGWVNVGGRDAATTVMPLISAALYLGQFVSPLIVNPLSRLLPLTTAPYAVGAAIALLFLAQTYATRSYHALAPRQ